MSYRPFVHQYAATLFGTLLLANACAHAQSQGATPPATLEAIYTHSHLTASQPRGEALNLRFTWEFDGGHVARAELLDERKFGSHGGLGGFSYSRVLTPDWIIAGTVLAGHGGLNWPNLRMDIEVTTKWTEQRNILTRLALYHASYDRDRSDRGLRISLVGYFPHSILVEGGVILNESNPGNVRSHMPFVAITYGQPGAQYLSLRISRGTEAYQAIGAGQELVDFKSRSVGVSWRRWMDRYWGFMAQAEHYHNPSYERITLGGGLFMQW